jgi:hypothetical protein
MTWVIGVLVLAVCVSLLWLRVRLPKSSYLAACEYWVYLPVAALPKQEDLMTRMVAENPYMTPGKPPIGAREGLLFTDIRLRLGLATRERNPHLFRPDLFADSAVPAKEALHALAASQAVARARYISETPLSDDRHLQFMPHMAAAILSLCDGSAVYDPVVERLWTAAEFDAELRRCSSAAAIGLHLRLTWRETESGYEAATRGLKKIGLPELRAWPLDADQEALALELLREAAERLWKEPAVPERMTLTAFDGGFELRFERAREGFARVQLFRVVSKP